MAFTACDAIVVIIIKGPVSGETLGRTDICERQEGRVLEVDTEAGIRGCHPLLSIEKGCEEGER